MREPGRLGGQEGQEAGEMLLRDLLDMCDLRLRLLAGTADIAFSGVNVVDLPEPGSYVAPDDLVLTGLMWHSAVSGEAAASEAFAAGLARAGARAVGAGEAFLGAVPADFVTACARHGLALVAVPADVPFSLVSSRVAASAGAAREREFAALLERSRSLITAVADGRGLGSAVSLLAAETGLSCHVLTPAGRVIAGSSRLSAEEVARLVRGYLTARRLPVVVGSGERARTVHRTAPGQGSRRQSWLIACPGDRAD